MSRFNLLLLGTEPGLRIGAVKTLGKVFSSNFVFEVETLPEAEKLLSKLHIDMLIVDLDQQRLDFLALDKRFPNTMFVALSHSPRSTEVPMNVYKHRMFSKSEFLNSLLAELRSMKRNPELPGDRARRQKVAQPADSEQFRDFSLLIAHR